MAHHRAGRAGNSGGEPSPSCQATEGEGGEIADAQPQDRMEVEHENGELSADPDQRPEQPENRGPVHRRELSAREMRDQLGVSEQTPTVTVVVTVKNRRERMMRCVDAVFAQDYAH